MSVPTRRCAVMVSTVVLVLMSAAVRADEYTYAPATAYDGGGHDYFTFGPSVDTAVAAYGDYAGIATEVTAVTPSGGSFLGSKAVILMGANGATATTVSMAWRTRTLLEIDGRSFGGVAYPEAGVTQYTEDGVGTAGRGVALAYDSYGIPSDVLDLQGVTGAYVLQVEYNESALIFDYPWWTEEYVDARNTLYLGTLETNGTGLLADYDEWVNAVDLNVVVDAQTGAKAVAWYKGTFDDFLAEHTDFTLNEYMGSFGCDTDTNTVWAVLNHNSEFAVVPEPGTMGLLGLGLLLIVVRRPKAHRRR